jgi:Glycerol-3-phosphate acyltransferase
MEIALAILAAYLLGSVPFAVVSSRIFGLADPRSYGSGNPGATNVLRSGNKKAAILTLVGDALKGWVAVFAAQKLGFSDAVVGLVALAVFFGHLFPVFLKFKGGKGVATGPAYCSRSIRCSAWPWPAPGCSSPSPSAIPPWLPWQHPRWRPFSRFSCTAETARPWSSASSPWPWSASIGRISSACSRGRNPGSAARSNSGLPRSTGKEDRFSRPYR